MLRIFWKSRLKRPTNDNNLLNSAPNLMVSATLKLVMTCMKLSRAA
jgi:hypothetical protein